MAQKDDISIIMEKINHPGATIITKHDDLERIETSGISFCLCITGYNHC